MRHMIAAVLMTLALALPAKATEDIEKVISSQIDAFLAYQNAMIDMAFATGTVMGSGGISWSIQE